MEHKVSGIGLALIAGLISFITFVIILFSYALYPIYLFTTNSPIIDQFFQTGILPQGMAFAPISGGRVLGAILIALPKLIGLLIFYKSFQLCLGYIRGRRFSIRTTTSLGIIGWSLVAVALAELLGRILAIYCLSGSLVLGGIYGDGLHPGWLLVVAVIGYLLVLIKNIMINALKLEEENKAFV